MVARLRLVFRPETKKGPKKESKKGGILQISPFFLLFFLGLEIQPERPDIILKKESKKWKKIRFFCLFFSRLPPLLSFA